MYSRQDFVERFRETDTEELFGRIVTGDVTDEARDAIHIVLMERGIAEKEISTLASRAEKAQYRRTSPTNECDFCGQSVRFSTVEDEGQKFCSDDCLRNARLMEASVDIPEQEILKRAAEIQDGPCPACGGGGSRIEWRKSYWVWSALFFTRWGTSAKFCCKKCGIQANLLSIGSCLMLGWWGFPFGLLLTPIQIIANTAAIFRRFDKSKHPEDVMQAARLQLAVVLHEQQVSGPNNVP
ncbi:MAG: hypothetical protein GY794_15125 [bacterium]|nr:hypothetical protein [bacterium]